MATLYISIILFFRVVQAVFSKRSSIEIKNIPMLIKYTSFKNVISTVFCIGVLIASGNGFRCDGLTFLIAFISGISLFLCSFFGIYALKSGTVALSSMFATAGMLIPILSGLLFFDRPVHTMQWVGLCIFFVSAWLLIQSSKKIYSGFSLKTLLILLASLFFNGATMLAQQMFTVYVPNGDVSVFSLISFSVPAVLGSLIVLAIKFRTKETDTDTDTHLSKILVFCGTALAIAVFFINQFATLATALVPPIILFTIINGGETIMATLVASVLYKEKLSVRSTFGVILGVISFIIIKSF